eukprot:719086-Prorocentrum_minimum.AAC.1
MCPLRTPNRRCAASRHPQSPPADTKRAPRAGHRIPPSPPLREAYLRVLRGVHAAPADKRHKVLQRHHEG